MSPRQIFYRRLRIEPIRLADEWLERHIHDRWGIFVIVGYDDLGRPYVWLRAEGRFYSVRGHSWTNVIRRAVALLPELVSSDSFDLE